eukprot:22932-Chlamydomonas_euryale.AAC.1
MHGARKFANACTCAMWGCMHALGAVVHACMHVRLWGVCMHAQCDGACVHSQQWNVCMRRTFRCMHACTRNVSVYVRVGCGGASLRPCMRGRRTRACWHSCSAHASCACRCLCRCRRRPSLPCPLSADQLRETVSDESLEKFPDAGAAFNIGIMMFRPKSLAFVGAWRPRHAPLLSVPEQRFFFLWPGWPALLARAELRTDSPLSVTIADLRTVSPPSLAPLMPPWRTPVTPEAGSSMQRCSVAWWTA